MCYLGYAISFAKHYSGGKIGVKYSKLNDCSKEHCIQAMQNMKLYLYGYLIII